MSQSQSGISFESDDTSADIAAATRIRKLESELARYQSTIKNLEKQWQDAVNALQNDEATKKIATMTGTIAEQQKVVIALKKENQDLRGLWNEDETKKKITEIEAKYRTRENELLAENQALKNQIADLQVDNTSKDFTSKRLSQQVASYQDTVTRYRSDAEQKQRELIQMEVPLAEELTAAKERILILERELEAQNNYFSTEEERVRVKTEALEDQLRKSHLYEVQGKTVNQQLQGRFNDVVEKEKGYEDVIYMLKDEINHMNKKSEEDSIEHEKFKNQAELDIERIMAEKNQVLRENQLLARNLAAVSENAGSEKNELEIELRKKHNLLTNELASVTAHADKQVDQLYAENQQLKRTLEEQAERLEDLEGAVSADDHYQLKRKLVDYQTQLKDCADLIKNMQNEIRTITEFSDREANKYLSEIDTLKQVAGPLYSGDDQDWPEDHSVVVMRREIRKLRDKFNIRTEDLNESKLENRDLASRIVDLERELHLQGDFFNKEITDHVTSHTNMQKSSIVDEKKYMELLHKYSLLQQEYLKEKQEIQKELEETAAITKQKIDELQYELTCQEKYTDSEIDRFTKENEYLRSEIARLEDQIANFKVLVDKLTGQVKTLETDKLNIEIANRHKEQRLAKAESRIRQFEKRHDVDSESEASAGDTGLSDTLSDYNKRVRTPGDKSGAEDYPESVASDGLPPLSFFDIFRMWSESGPTESTRSDILARIARTSTLRRECLKFKEDFFSMLREAMSIRAHQIYGNGVILISELIDDKDITLEEAIEVGVEIPAIKCLKGLQENENEKFNTQKHVAGLSLSGMFTNWTDEMTETVRLKGAIDTLANYAKQDTQEWQKFHSLKIIALLIQDGTLNLELRMANVVNSLLASLEYHTTSIRRMAAEALGHYLEDQDNRLTLEDDKQLGYIINAIYNSKDYEFLEDLLYGLLNLLKETRLRTIIYESGIVDVLSSLALAGPLYIQIHIYKIFTILVSDANKEVMLNKSANALNKTMLGELSNPDVNKVVQTIFIFLKKLDSNLAFAEDILTILPGLVACAKFTDDPDIYEVAFQLILAYGKAHGQDVLPILESKHNGINVAITFYTLKPEFPLSIRLIASNLLNLFCFTGYGHVIGERAEDIMLSEAFVNLDQEEELREDAAFLILGILSEQDPVRDLANITDFRGLMSMLTDTAPESEKFRIQALRIIHKITPNRANATGIRILSGIENLLALLKDEELSNEFKILSIQSIANIIDHIGIANEALNNVIDVEYGFAVLCSALYPIDSEIQFVIQPIWQLFEDQAKNPELLASVARYTGYLEYVLHASVSPHTNTEFRNILNNFITELSKDVNFTAKIAQMKKAMNKWKPSKQKRGFGKRERTQLDGNEESKEEEFEEESKSRQGFDKVAKAAAKAEPPKGEKDPNIFKRFFGGAVGAAAGKDKGAQDKSK